MLSRWRVQGVGGVLKRRIQQAASGGGAGMRPMLLFPEVCSGLHLQSAP